MEFRNHPILIFRRMFIVLAFFIALTSKEIYEIIKNGDNPFFVIKSIMEFIETGDNTKEVGIFFVILIIFSLIIFSGYFLWKNSYIKLEENNLVFIKKGLFRRKKKVVNYKNITNITMKSGLFSKIVGYKIVSCDISSTNEVSEDDYIILLSNSKANLFRDLVSRKQRTGHIEDEDVEDASSKFVNANDEIGNSKKLEKIDFKYSFTIKDKLVHVFFEEGISIIFQIILVLFTFIEITNPKFIFIAIIIIIPTIKKVCSCVDRYFGYEIQRHDNEITITYGLIDSRNYNIPCDNILSLKKEESFLSRIFGFSKLGFEVLGVGNEKDESKELSLFMKNSIISDYIEALVPEFNIKNIDFAYPDRRYGLYRSLRAGLSLGIILLLLRYVGIINYLEMKFTMLPIIIYVLTLALFIYMSISFFWYRSVKLEEDRLIICEGIFSKSITTILFENIDLIRLEYGIFGKVLKVEKLVIGFKDSKGKTIEDLGYFKKGFFNSLVKNKYFY